MIAHLPVLFNPLVVTHNDSLYGILPSAILCNSVKLEEEEVPHAQAHIRSSHLLRIPTKPPGHRRHQAQVWNQPRPRSNQPQPAIGGRKPACDSASGKKTGGQACIAMDANS